MTLSRENYTKGFLIDDELLGGVSEDPDRAGAYLAFVLRQSSGEYLGYNRFDSLDEALEAVNLVERAWKFEKSGGCGDGKCSTGGCGKGKCGVDTQDHAIS